MPMELIKKLFSSWEFIAVVAALLFIIPLVFKLASLDKRPVTVKKVQVKKKKIPQKQPEEESEDDAL